MRRFALVTQIAHPIQLGNTLLRHYFSCLMLNMYTAMTGDPVFTESQAFDTLGLQPGEEQAKIDQKERQAYATNYLGEVAGNDPTYSPVSCGRLRKIQ